MPCGVFSGVGQIIKIGQIGFRDVQGLAFAPAMIDAVKSPSEGPSVLTLAQNYPNPFNAGTKVRYSLPRDIHVLLRVFNTRGQLVRVLVDE